MRYFYLVLSVVFLQACSNTNQGGEDKTPPSKTNEMVSTLKFTNGLATLQDPGLVRNGVAFGADVVVMDVDGDGDTELLIGASLSNLDGSDTGVVYVYERNGTYFANTYSLLIRAPITNGAIHFGTALALADIDRDGNNDLLVSAPADDSCGGTDRGAVYVFLYKNTGIDRSPNLKICYPGSTNGAYFGYDIATGDLDSDGNDDLVISAYAESTDGVHKGRAYVFLNDGDWAVDQTLYLGSGANEDRFGSFVALIHANSDTHLDVAVGVYNRDIDSGTNNGAVYVYYNDGTGTFNATAPELVIKPNYNENYSYFGYSGVGVDLNLDGRRDLLVSQPGLDLGFANRGSIFVYTTFETTEESSPDIRVEYGSEDNPYYAYFGYWISEGDINEDGKNDIIIAINDSATSINETKLLFYENGSTSFTTPVFSLKNENISINPYTRFASAVAVGDLDGDGVKDLAVGVPEEDELYNGWNNVGLVFIYKGVKDSSFRDTPNFIIRPPYPCSNEYFGYALHIMDVNGDTKPDLLVGAPQDELVGADTGSVYIYYGGKDVFDTVSDAVITDPDGGSYNWFGSSITSGDLNGDKYPELVIGAERDDNGGTDRGTVYIWRTNSSIVDYTKTPDQIIHCSFTECSNSSYFGSSLAIVDVNPTNGSDNYNDLLVGAEGLDYTGTNAGGVFVFYGSAASQDDNDIDISSHGMINDPSDNSYNYFGSAMFVADFDNDDYQDLIIGARGEDSYFNNSGAVYFWYIKDTSFNITSSLPNVRYYGETSAEQGLGASISASDLDGDGHLDLITGASEYDTPKQDAGILYFDTQFESR